MNQKVSIVIPAYNEEKCLAATLTKVCALEYPNFEVIVVDNASADRTGEIARTFPVKVVREEKKGLLHARERGRVEATGEFIANIDADCLPEKDWLANGMQYFTSEKIVAVSGPYDYFDGKWAFRTSSLFLQKYVYSGISKAMQAFGKSGVLIGGNNIIRAQTLAEVGGYDTSILFYGEDTDTARRVSQKGTIVFSSRFRMPTSARRFHNEGTIRIATLYFYHFFRGAFKKSTA